jgi:hypothetical protein
MRRWLRSIRWLKHRHCSLLAYGRAARGRTYSHHEPPLSLGRIANAYDDSFDIFIFECVTTVAVMKKLRIRLQSLLLRHSSTQLAVQEQAATYYQVPSISTPYYGYTMVDNMAQMFKASVLSKTGLVRPAPRMLELSAVRMSTGRFVKNKLC